MLLFAGEVCVWDYGTVVHSDFALRLRSLPIPNAAIVERHK